MNEADHQALTLLVKTIYPYQPRYLSIPFSWAKRKLMKATGLNRWDFDKWIIDLRGKTFDGDTYAFYPLKCDSLPASRLNYVSGYADYCSLQFDLRNKYMKTILVELKKSKDA